MVSFQPEYYLSDAEPDLMKQNRNKPEEYRAFLRKALDNKISGQIEKSISSESLLSDTSRKAMESTWDFYNHSLLSYKNPYGIKSERKTSAEKPNDVKPLTDQHGAITFNQSKEALKVMDNKINDANWLQSFAADAGADLILSLNQFEIKTNYNSCLDISRGIYRREIHVHYTIMTAGGKQLAASVAVAAFPSNDNRVEDIAERVFPSIATEISAQVGHQLK